VYYAILGETMKMPGLHMDSATLAADAEEPDALVTLVVDTLLHGAAR
jgi:hypothetical protein